MERERRRRSGSRRGGDDRRRAWRRWPRRPSAATGSRRSSSPTRAAIEPRRVARETAARLGLALTVCTGPGAGVRAGTAAGDGRGGRAAGRADGSGGLIATTDADSAPAPDWLERQLAHLARGASVIAGRSSSTPTSGALPAPCCERRERDAETRMSRRRGRRPRRRSSPLRRARRWASPPRSTARVGGLDAMSALEDEAFARELAVHGIPILRAADVRVRTSVRTDGRARARTVGRPGRGDLVEQRRYRPASSSSSLARRASGRRHGRVIPAGNAPTTVAGVIETTVGAGLRRRAGR